MIKRIAIIGPESSGKTTLSRALSKKLEWRLVEEYAREYFETHDYHSCDLDDLINISKKQFSLAHNNQNDLPIVSDTEIITIEIWAQDKFSEVPKQIIERREKQLFDLYVLSLPDMIWEPDKLRTDANRREVIYHQYLDLIRKYGLNYIEVSGNIEHRIKQILKYIKIKLESN